MRAVPLILLAWAGTAEAACRQALAIGLDVSGSVDAVEYRLQIDGLAGALLRADVQAAFLALPAAPVRLYVYEWAGLPSQRMLQPWIDITSPDDLNAVATRLRASPRVNLEPPTAIGQAMRHAGRALAEQTGCWRRTLDLTGDGQSNTGPRPRDLSDDPALSGVTVNALVIGASAQDQTELQALWAYFKTEVIRGPQAFVEVAVDFQDFEDAMARKLLKELQTLAVSQLAD